MDGKKIKKNKSLQTQINYWMIISVTIFAIIAATIGGLVNFHEASELQDSTLKAIANLVLKGQISKQATYNKDDDEAITVGILNESLMKEFTLSEKDIEIKGFLTRQSGGKPWRIYIQDILDSKDKVIVFQQTEARDEVAWNSSLSVFIPIVLMLALLLFVIKNIMESHFKPLRKLSDFLNEQSPTDLKILSENGASVEILPFLRSINGLLERTQASVEEQQKFIANAAHELRTPVSALSLLAENLQNAKSEKELRERQLNLSSGLVRLRKLINQLLDLARLQNKIKNSVKPVLFNDVIRETIADLYLLAEEKKINLGVIKNQPIKVLGGEMALNQLVRNAIENAIFYTPEGGKIDVSLSLEGSLAVLTVEDTGPGIAPEETEKIWQAFYRSSDAQSRKEGNGLGLAIVSEIANQLGGKVSLSNLPKKGAVFRYQQDIIE